VPDFRDQYGSEMRAQPWSLMDALADFRERETGNIRGAIDRGLATGRVGATSALSAIPWALGAAQNLPRNIAERGIPGGIAKTGIGALMGDYMEEAPGGALALEEMGRAQERADLAGVSRPLQFAAEIGTPDPWDFRHLAAVIPPRIAKGEGIKGRAHPKVEVDDLSGVNARGAYSPFTGEVKLDRESLKTMNREERAALVRHELAHKAESERELWMETDTFLWDLWESDRANPIWDYMSDVTQRVDMSNKRSPEIIADLYANHYAKGTFPAEVFTGPHAKEGIQEFPIPDELMRVLDEIEGELGIWTKRADRTAAKTSKAAPTAPTAPGGLREVDPTAPDPGSNMAGLRALFPQPESVGGTRPWRNPAPDAPAASASLNYRPVLQLDPSQPAERMPRQPGTPRGKQRGISTSTSVRGLDYEDAVAEALTGKHLQWSGGEPGTGFVGAGPGIDTSADLRALRGRYDSYVEDGRL